MYREDPLKEVPERLFKKPRLLRYCVPRNDKQMRSYVIASDSENRAAISSVTVGLPQQPPGTFNSPRMVDAYYR
ncbi:MAG: hypothetical protein P8Z79_24780, partial [Sedimentisphaerales bacterium]